MNPKSYYLALTVSD